MGIFLLGGNDHLLGYVRAYGVMRLDFVAKKPVQGGQGSSESQFLAKKRVAVFVSFINNRNRVVLLGIESIRYVEFNLEHRVRHDELLCRLSNLSAQRVFCACVRDERRRTDCALGVCRNDGYFLRFGNRMFYHLFGKRFIRLFQLDKNGKTAKGRSEYEASIKKQVCV